jgi:hypothetical protein
MNLRTKHIIGKIGFALFALSMGLMGPGRANARIVFDNEYLLQNNGATKWTIDSLNMTTGNLQLQFGNSLTPTNNGIITWDITNHQFDLDHSLDMGKNQLKNLVLDTRSGTPPATPVGGQIYYDNTDGNTYVWNSVTSVWEDVTALGVTQTKVVTVGSSGYDYTTIAAAATYLNTLNGGIILLSAENQAVTTAVNLSNITLVGKDASKTIITVSGSGKLNSFDTAYKNLKIQVNSMATNYAIDTQLGASSLFFEWVDIGVLNGTDSLIGSSAGTPPTVTIKLVNCNQTAGSGTILKTMALSNLNVASNVFVSSSSGNNLLQISDWPVTIAGAGNVLTGGAISTIPSNTIYVYPGMNLQGAINSLTTGGYITLLPGTQTITAPLVITHDNIVITGYGDSSIISASGFSGITSTTAAIQVGAADGSAPNNQVVLKDFQLQVGSNNIHGIRVAGGQDNQVTNVTVKKTAGSGVGSGEAGIQILNSSAAAINRPVIKSNRILGTSGTIYFSNGIQVLLNNAVFAGTKGTENALIDGNTVDFVGEDAYKLVGVENSAIFNNRGSRTGVDGAATASYGIYLSNAANMNVNANAFLTSMRTDAVGIGIEPDNQGALKLTTDSIFTANTMDGMANSGVGFKYGFLIGNATNTTVDKNSIQNNSILGASAVTTVAIDIRGDADDNSIANNSLTGGTNAWGTGIYLESSAEDRNIVQNNRYSNVTVLLTDNGTDTRREVTHHEATVNPTVTDDQSKGLKTGVIWVNTVTQTSYISVNDTVGAAVWNQLDAATSVTGDKYLWVDIAGGIRTSATTGTVASTNSPVIQFDGVNASNSRWSFPVPDDWQAGTNINVDVFWSPSDATAGNLVFSLIYAGFSSGTTVAAGSFATLSNTVAAPGVMLQLNSTTFAMNGASLAANQMVDINLLRDPTVGADTYAGNANIQMVRIRYTGKKLQ